MPLPRSRTAPSSNLHPTASHHPFSTKKEQRLIQQICRKFLFVSQATDGTGLVPLNSIASQQSTPTEETKRKASQFLDYIAFQEEAILTYSASDTIIAAHSDASYLIKPKARSQAGGHFFLSQNVEYPPNNGAILNVAQIIKNVITSATEA